VGGVLVTAVETSDRKRAEDALRHLNQTLEAQVADRVRERDEIWQVSQDMLLVIDREGDRDALGLWILRRLDAQRGSNRDR
jgi:hypothetical protein